MQFEMLYFPLILFRYFLVFYFLCKYALKADHMQLIDKFISIHGLKNLLSFSHRSFSNILILQIGHSHSSNLSGVEGEFLSKFYLF